MPSAVVVPVEVAEVVAVVVTVVVGDVVTVLVAVVVGVVNTQSWNVPSACAASAAFTTDSVLLQLSTGSCRYPATLQVNLPLSSVIANCETILFISISATG